MRLIFIMIFSSLFLACNHQEKKDVENSFQEKDSPKAVNRDSIKQAFLHSIGEPLIRNERIEVYRFVLSDALGKTVILRIQKDTDNTVKLFSKYFLSSGEYGVVRLYKGKKINIQRDTIIDAEIQEVEASFWQSFKKELDGSYYWALTNPCPKGNGVTDGYVLYLESMSFICKQNVLTYHEVEIHEPNNGSFRDACQLLLDKSTMIKEGKIKFW